MSGEMDYLPVPDNAAWRAADFTSADDYTAQFDREDFAELDQVVGAIIGTGHGFTHTTQSNFPFIKLAPKLTDVYEEMKGGRGFVFLRGLPAKSRSAEWMRTAYWGIGTWLGDAVNQLIQGSMLTDVARASKDRTDARYYNSADELDLHVDPTCDIVGVACYRQAGHGGETFLGSAITVHNDMAGERPDLLPILYRGFYLPRFGEYWPDDGDVTSYRVPFFAKMDGKLSWRGFHPSMFAAAREREERLMDQEVEAIETFNNIAKRSENRLPLRLLPGDIWFTNNLVVQHGRGRFSNDARTVEPRLLFRLWLSARDFRPIPSEMNFFNRGVAGIPVIPGKRTYYSEVEGIKMDAHDGRSDVPAWARAQ